MLFSLTDSIFLILPPRLVVEAQGGMQSWIFIYLSLFYPEQSLYSNSVLWDKQSKFQTFSSPQQDGILEEQIKLQFQVASLSWVSSKAMYIIFVIIALDIIHMLRKFNLLKVYKWGTSLVVQRLRLWAPNAGDLGSIPGQGTRSHMLQPKIPYSTTEIEDPVCLN